CASGLLVCCCEFFVGRLFLWPVRRHLGCFGSRILILEFSSSRSCFNYLLLLRAGCFGSCLGTLHTKSDIHEDKNRFRAKAVARLTKIRAVDEQLAVGWAQTLDVEGSVAD